MRHLACTFSQMKSINTFSMFLPSGVPSHFLWRFIVVWPRTSLFPCLCISMLTPNSSGNMQKPGYWGCFHAASAREKISGVWGIMSAEHTAFSFYRVWATKMSAFRQWAWEMVSKRRRAPVNVRTSCMSANEGSKARLGVVQPRQSVWLPHQHRNWTATDQPWSYCCRRGAQLSVSWRTAAVIPWKWKQNRQILWRSSTVLKLAVLRRFSNKNRQCVMVALSNEISKCG